MLLGMPVLDVSRFIVSGIKVTFFIGVTLYLNSWTPQLRGYLTEAKDRAFSGFGSLASVDLGCVSHLVGIDTVMQSIMNSLFLAGNFYISAVITILSFRFAMRLFAIGMKV